MKICHIENTVAALEEAIKNKKVQMQTATAYSGHFSMPHLFLEILNRARRSYTQTTKALEQGGGFFRDSLKKARQSVQERPWQVLIKAAAGSFAIGWLWGVCRRRKKG